jgi:hypothetical protein
MEMARMLGPPHYYPYRQLPRASRVGSGPHVALIVLTGDTIRRGTGRVACARVGRVAPPCPCRTSAGSGAANGSSQRRADTAGAGESNTSARARLETCSLLAAPRHRNGARHGTGLPRAAVNWNGTTVARSPRAFEGEAFGRVGGLGLVPINCVFSGYGQRKSSTSCWNCRTFSTYLPTPSGSAEA